jgi:hypothetical protein
MQLHACCPRLRVLRLTPSPQLQMAPDALYTECRSVPQLRLPPTALEKLAGSTRLVDVPLPFAEPRDGGVCARWPTAPYLPTLTTHLHRFPQLQRLDLSGPFYGLSMSSRLAAVLNTLEQLVYLVLALGGVRDEHIATLRLRSLRALTWHSLSHVSDLAVVHTCRNCLSIVSLSLLHCSGLTDRTLILLAHGGLPKLTWLDAAGCAFSALWAERAHAALWPSADKNGSIGRIGLGAVDCAGRVRVPTTCEGVRCVWEEMHTQLHICPALDCRGHDKAPAGECSRCQRPLCDECVLDWEYDTFDDLGRSDGAPLTCEGCCMD